jgi:hypothetical protein
MSAMHNIYDMCRHEFCTIIKKQMFPSVKYSMSFCKMNYEFLMQQYQGFFCSEMLEEHGSSCTDLHSEIPSSNLSQHISYHDWGHL